MLTGNMYVCMRTREVLTFNIRPHNLNISNIPNTISNLGYSRLYDIVLNKHVTKPIS